MIQINAQLTFRDYLHYSYYNFFRRPLTKLYLGLFILIISWDIYNKSVDVSAVSCKKTGEVPRKTVDLILSEHLTLGNPSNATADLNMQISD